MNIQHFENYLHNLITLKDYLGKQVVVSRKIYDLLKVTN